MQEPECSAGSAACQCGLPGGTPSQDRSEAATACCPVCGSRCRASCLWRRSCLPVLPPRQADRAAHLTGHCPHCSGRWACLLTVVASECRRLHRAAGSQQGAAGCPGTAPTSRQAAAPRPWRQIPAQWRLLAVASCSQGRAGGVKTGGCYCRGQSTQFAREQNLPGSMSRSRQRGDPPWRLELWSSAGAEAEQQLCVQPVLQSTLGNDLSM